ncbi:MAG: polyphosphate polymerase domain-containing protein [Deltaproteobacteria bacterium]|nr:polyphosphate polymerase domain-containing protein [Deltaproteobacteria bacterium]
MSAGLTPNLRYERKYLPEGCSVAQVLAVLRRHPALFREVFPPRDVNSLYLDTPGLRDYHDHVQGAARRSKTRIRWYGDAEGAVVKPLLERKLKAGAVSGKLSQPLPPIEIALCEARIRTALNDLALSDRLRAELRLVQPAVVTRYFRYYFATAGGRIRVTVDTHLQVAAIRGRTHPALVQVPPGHAVVVELKYDPAWSEQAAAVADHLPFRLARCSKYLLGVEIGR